MTTLPPGLSEEAIIRELKLSGQYDKLKHRLVDGLQTSDSKQLLERTVQEILASQDPDQPIDSAALRETTWHRIRSSVDADLAAISSQPEFREALVEIVSQTVFAQVAQFTD